MINNKKVLAIIPARGGSKGVLRKNIRSLAGRPLIAWTIEKAKKSKYIDRVILSSEDTEIIEVAKSFGCDVPFVRPVHLAEDDTPGIEPMLHALNVVTGYDYAILLQPTSPLREVEDIDRCIEQLFEMKAPACVSVSEPDKSPYWMYTLQENLQIRSLISQSSLISCRQELPKVYALNGAVYIAEIEWLKEKKSFLMEETVGYVMPKSRSFDIDTEEDFLVCEYYLKRKMNQDFI